MPRRCSTLACTVHCESWELADPGGLFQDVRQQTLLNRKKDIARVREKQMQAVALMNELDFLATSAAGI